MVTRPDQSESSSGQHSPFDLLTLREASAIKERDWLTILKSEAEARAAAERLVAEERAAATADPTDPSPPPPFAAATDVPTDTTPLIVDHASPAAVPLEQTKLLHRAYQSLQIGRANV